MLSVYICPKGLQRIACALKKERRAAHTHHLWKNQHVIATLLHFLNIEPSKNYLVN